MQKKVQQYREGLWQKRCTGDEEEERKMVSDRRVQYTKSVIREALFQVLEDKPLEKITVKEICETADINRTTFYRYYTDIYDLYASVERELIQEIFPEGGLSGADIRSLTEKLFGAVYGHQSFYREFFRSRMESEGMKQVVEQKYEELLAVMHEKGGEESERIYRYSLEYMKSGILGLMKNWVDDGCSEPPEKMAEIITGIAEKQLGEFL